ncbi:Cro/CI family transcriptional regulator [Acinetobacter baumannii]|uniref:Cro/CI family transcriptional regulator n=1 Tax=Acinetobacter baumannii TaxID=470 RepID=UPI001CDC9B2C|nr:Cro/CI family transcriptional regulator [Acinetobacter baumannii]MCA4232756.1 Cro/CI family transcriptional regulator [Acinetobacter baumannii]
MTVDDLKNHFCVEKDIQLTKTVLGVTRGTISKWRHKGIPLDTQARIQVLTKGKLKANLLEARA